MQIDYSHKLVRTLGLKVFAVYFLMACAEQEGLVPITRNWLMDQMPYNTSPGTITDALRYLTSPENQIAVRVNGGWRLATAVQLPLMNQLDEGFEPKCPQSGHLGSVVVVDDLSLNVPTITTTTTTIGEISAERTFEESAALKAALDEFKIIGKKRVALIACEWVTGEYVRASVKQAQDERLWDNPLGMAITRMLEHVEVDEKALQEKEVSWRYGKGEFAAMLEDAADVEHTDDCCCIQCKRAYPERFCQFKIVHPAEMLSRGRMQGGWTTVCHEPLKPGQKYCNQHQKESEEE